ncbi:PorV/PorQ family protein [candidate division KSB1 bacterium]|nr:PorV/PorQ family protein [candidate division KSB1 bacterium]
MLLILLLATQAYPVSEAGILFLLISPGVRADGMGEAFVAISDDVSAVYWNPGGLAFQDGSYGPAREFIFMHSNWLPQLTSDLFYDFAAYKHYVYGLGTFGISLTYLNLGEQIITYETGPEEMGRFMSYDAAAALSYGTTMTDNIGMGVTIRLIRSNLAPIGAGAEQGKGQTWAFNFDMGLLYRNMLFDGFNLGMNVSNIGPKIAYIDVDQADPQPTNLKIGLAYRIFGGDLSTDSPNRLTAAVDVNKLLVRRRKDGTSDPVYKALFTSWADDPFEEEMKKLIAHGGLEYWYDNMVALRAGYWHDEEGKVKPWTFGFGLRFKLYELDFGYITAGEGHPLTDTMRFSLQIGF